jgi:hypothetical protein
MLLHELLALNWKNHFARGSYAYRPRGLNTKTTRRGCRRGAFSDRDAPTQLTNLLIVSQVEIGATLSCA